MKPNGGKQRCDKCSKPLPGGNARCSYCKGSFAGKSSSKDGGLARRESFFRDSEASHKSSDMFGSMFGGLMGSNDRSGESSRHRKAKSSFWDSDDDSHQSRDMFGGMFGGLMGSKDRDRRSGESSRHRKAKSSFWDSDSDDDSHQSHDMFGRLFGGLMGSKDRDRRSGESSRHNRRARPSLWDSDDDSHQVPDMFGSMFGGLMGSSSGETSRHRMNVPLLRDPGPSHQVPDMFGGMLGGLMGSNGPERRFTEPSRNHDVRRNSSSEHNWDPFSIFRGSTSSRGNPSNARGQIDSGDYSVSTEQEEQIQQRSMNDSRAPPPASGVSVKSLPKIKITKEHLKKDLQCAVCQENFEFGSEGREMPCNHIYHEDCLGPWLRENNSCPVCRFELPPPRKPFWLRLLHCIGLDGCLGLD